MRYTEIKIEEMRDLLKQDKGWFEPKNTAHEFVFEYKVPFWDGAVVQVYTSINKHNGFGRRKGKDCIRVVGVDLKNQRGLHRAIRVLRVSGWRDNLKVAVTKVLKDLYQRKPR
jgi:hypothetical protein